jgi:acetyl-CoA carboxylase / biotin carboxylase 1
MEPVTHLRSPQLSSNNIDVTDIGELDLNDESKRRGPSASLSSLYASVDEYVKSCQGKKVIKKVLIANNGIGAVKCIRSIRQWAYENFGDDRAIIFVCMATPEDLRSNAEYIRMADECIEVPGGANNNNYANVQLIVRLAQQSGADAVWPGWGHASENPVLPDTLSKMNIAFIGPESLPMNLLGDKIGSTIIAQSAKCPTISWNGDGLTVDTENLQNGIPSDLYDKANVKTVEDCLGCCARIGYPVMIKASEGGGGKGVRMVNSDEDVVDAYKAVQGEVPGSPIFCMKLSSGARHLEVQLLADEYGEAIALSGRDCSIQRRFQKIIEEGPPLAPSDEVWVEMEKAAVRLAKAVKYSNAGTVEYLYKDGKFYFLELNPRLQVEHPVTEMITGINLPAAQLNVAMGIPLHRIPDVRKIFKAQIDPTVDRIPFDTLQVQSDGHVIACRITAENPDSGFTPTSGLINELTFRNSRNVWGYFSLGSNGSVHEFADSQIGHIFSWGPTREVARKGMAIALKELSIRGEIRTTVDYLVKIMEDSEYRRNRIDTTWLDKRIRADAARLPSLSEELSNDTMNSKSLYMSSSIIIAIVGAACRAHQIKLESKAQFIESLQRGQTPATNLVDVTYPVELIYNDIKYKFKASQNGPDSFVLECNNSWVLVAVRGLSDDGMLVMLGGKSFNVYLKSETGGLRMVVDGQTYVFTKEYDPTKIVANMAGKLVRYMVEDGAHVTANSAFCEIEVMKMFMPLLVPEPGCINFKKSEGSVLEPGDLIANVVLDEPDKVRKATLFEKRLPKLGSPWPDHDMEVRGVHHVFRDSLKMLQNILAGRVVPDSLLKTALNDLDMSLCNVSLPVFEIVEAISVLTGRIPPKLEKELNDFVKPYHTNGKKFGKKCNVCETADILEKYLVSLGEREADALKSQLAPILEISDRFKDGIDGHRELVLTSLVENYLNVEQHFAVKSTYAEILMKLRETFSSTSSITNVYDHAVSHARLQAKNDFIIELLRNAKDPLRLNGLSKDERKSARKDSKLLPLLAGLSTLSKDGVVTYAPVTLTARKMLIRFYLPSLIERQNDVKDVLAQCPLTPIVEVVGDEVEKRGEMLASLTDGAQPIFESIVHFLKKGTEDNKYGTTAMEAYIRRTFRTYNIVSITGPKTKSFQYVRFYFNQIVQLNTAAIKGMRKSDSFGNLGQLLSGAKPHQGNAINSPERNLKDMRWGVMCVFNTYNEMKDKFNEMISLIDDDALKRQSFSKENPPNTIHVVLLDESLGGEYEEEYEAQNAETSLITTLQHVIQENMEQATLRGVRRVTVVSQYAPKVTSSGIGSSESESSPGIYTFRARNGFSEDSIVRHIDPTQAFRLELSRMCNYKIKQSVVPNRAVHVYEAVPNQSTTSATSSRKKQIRTRFFVRSLVRNMRGIPTFYYSGSKKQQLDAYPGPEARFVDCLDALEVAIQSHGNSKTNYGNYIFLNCLQDIVMKPEYFEAIISNVYNRYADRIRRLRVSEVEFRLTARIEKNTPKINVRMIVSDPTGFVPILEMYVETSDGETGRSMKALPTGSLGKSNSSGMKLRAKDGQDPQAPHPLFNKLQEKRQTARAITGTCYAYDFLSLFEKALRAMWKSSSGVPASRGALLQSVELVLDETTFVESSSKPKLKEIVRKPGENDIGMVAWLVTMKTPECPAGRQMVLIANDITHKAGSFGTVEDKLFSAASEYARTRGIPRIYLAANSGARIGMAEEVKKAYKVAWINENDPSKGFNYIYVTPEDYQQLSAQGSLMAKAVTVVDSITGESEERYIITDIIGSSPDLGVENLRGSGTIAGDTSRAYEDVFTLTYVTGRCVGIGAYLVRLGQRTIQKVSNAPILLTGYQALNKLMGTPVYSSNSQLGGPSIMYSNGVSHLTVDDDIEGVHAILKWLSYVPAVRGGALPIMQPDSNDSPDRNVEVIPTKNPSDPRLYLTGTLTQADTHLREEQFLSGFFDKNSWIESMAGWAKTVVTGRARLGGIPMGVIVPEARTVEYTIPADPASPLSREQVVKQAGGVWFPDSAYKTSQAIHDFNREGLPLIIFANWRGFSGGQRDMFDEVLKFGATIVDALVQYKQPVFVYLPPGATLRGGAWAVLDPTINPDKMEMYADPKSRGGILEAPGAVSIKYRTPQLLQKARELDPVLQRLGKEIQSIGGNDEKTKDLENQMKERESSILQSYVQVATHFADLHDTPGRMKAKGAIHGIIDWRRSRGFFYWRLRRKLAEFSLVQHIKKMSSHLSDTRISEMLRVWYIRSFKRRRSTSPEPMSTWRHYAGGVIAGSPSQISTSPTVQVQDDPVADNLKWADDRKFLAWMSNSAAEIDREVASLRENHVVEELMALFNRDRRSMLSGLRRVVQNLDPSERAVFVKEFGPSGY